MFFIFGTNSAVKPMGEVDVSRCPACGRPVRMNLVVSYSYVHLFFIPLFRWNKRYIATCPCCASVLSLDPETGKRLKAGEALTLSGGELTLTRNNSVGLCPGCGAHNPSGSVYCNRCGRAL